MEREPDIEGLLAGEVAPRIGSRARFEDILERAHEAFVTMDEDGRIRAWNREAERTFGWAKEAVLGERLQDVLIPLRYRQRHEQGLARFLVTREGPLLNKRLEIMALHRSGHELPVEVTITSFEEDGRWSFHAFLHDISERRRATEVQARLATLVEHATDAIISRTAEGVITSWNPGAERLYGYSSQEMLGRLGEPLAPPERAAEERDLVARVLRGEPVESFETERVTKDGKRIDVSITISPIYDDAGRVAELAIFTRDISVSKDAQRALIRAYDELRHTNELKSQLVAVASHEIRTPLTSIIGFASTLLSRWEDLRDEDRIQFLRLVESQGRRLHKLVDDVLVFSRLEAGGTASAPSRVDLAKVAKQVIAERDLERETSLTVTGDATAHADPAHVHQILLNFLANGAAYGAPPFAITIEETDDSIVARVCDSGPGVPEAFVPHLFEAYTRALAHEAGKNGSGLGLAIAKGLAERGGGDVWYEPGSPRGACFCMRLPRRPAG